jgi:hypothetical protein
MPIEFDIPAEVARDVIRGQAVSNPPGKELRIFLSNELGIDPDANPDAVIVEEKSGPVWTVRVPGVNLNGAQRTNLADAIEAARTRIKFR